MLPPRAALAALLCFAFGCKADDPLPVSQPSLCAVGPINDHGLGKPCVRSGDCAGQAAVTCYHPDEASPAGYCAEYCFGFKPDECGAGGRCVSRGLEPNVCAPEACADAITIAPPPAARVKNPCLVGKVNDFGVGKPCTAMADCSEFSIAYTCPKALRPSNPNWCSLLCTADSDCGDNAFCWRRQVEERGVKFTIGSCAPVACREDEPTVR